MLKSISLTAGGGGVSRRKRFGPDVYSWPWINNTALQLALSEAAATGLVLGMGAPGGEENWLRGVRQGPLATGVTGATYARSGTRAGLDPANLFGPNVVRREAGRGVRVFGAGTNLIPASEAFDDAVWTKSRSSITANAATAPDGTTTADKLVEDTSNNTHRTFQGVAKAASAITYTFSVFLKAAERTFAQVKISDTTESDNAAVNVNLSTGAISGVTGSGFTGGSATITAFANNWYRVTLTATTDTETNINSFVFTASALGTVSYTGNGTSGILVWGAQLEQSAFATDYIPNASTVASASAGADDLVVGTGAGVTLGADHAFIIEGTVPDLIAGAFPAFIGWNASSESIGLFMTSVGQVGVNAGAGSVNLQGGPTLTKGQTVRALFRVSGGNTGRLFVNGVAAFSNTAFTPSTGLASFFMGQTPTNTNRLGSGLSIAAVLLRAPSDAECLAITAL